jgi:hypothetical protein
MVANSRNTQLKGKPMQNKQTINLQAFKAYINEKHWALPKNNLVPLKVLSKAKKPVTTQSILTPMLKYNGYFNWSHILPLVGLLQPSVAVNNFINYAFATFYNVNNNIVIKPSGLGTFAVNWLQLVNKLPSGNAAIAVQMAINNAPCTQTVIFKLSLMYLHLFTNVKHVTVVNTTNYNNNTKHKSTSFLLLNQKPQNNLYINHLGVFTYNRNKTAATVSCPTTGKIYTSYTFTKTKITTLIAQYNNINCIL